MRLYRIGSHPPPFCGNTPWVCVSGATQASGAEGHECSHLFLTDSRIQRSPARMFGKGLERTSAMRVCSRGTGHVIAGLTQRTGSWVATRTADTACRSKGLLHRAGIRLPGNLGHATGQFAAARLSICLGRGGVPARVIQVTLIYCILHVAGTGNGSKTGASGKPLSLTCVRGSAPRGAGDPPSCMRHKAPIQAASHAPHLRAATITPTYCTSPPASSRPCIMTHSARDILACRHAMRLTTTPLMAPAPCRLVECPTTDAVARVPRPCRATQGWRLPTPNRKARR